MMKHDVKIYLKKLSVPFFAVSILINSSTVPVIADTYEHLSLYVSAGSTNGDGSVAKPFGSIEEARDYIRELKKTGDYPKNGITVNLREGTYEILNPVQFTEEDAGTAEGGITYRAYLDEEVILAGGMSISLGDFTAVTDEKMKSQFPGIASTAVRQYDLYSNGITREMIGELEHTGVRATNSFSTWYDDGILTPCAKLFFNDDEMTIARWPNNGFSQTGEITDPGDLTDQYTESNAAASNLEYIPPENRPSYPRGFTFKIPADKAKLWAEAADGRVYGYFRYNWCDLGDNIKSIDTTENTLTTQHSLGHAPAAGKDYYVYNIPAELDSPGEYYIDRDKGILYFYPPAASGSCTMSINGGSFFSLSKGADYISIKNMTMTCGRSGAVEAYGCDGIAVEGCTVSNMSKTAVTIAGTHDSHVSNCHIYNIGMHGVLISSPEEDYKTLKQSGNFVENNWIHDWGQNVASYSGAVRPAGVGIRVSNNKFNSAPHLAVNLYGNDNLVEYNDISDVLNEAADSGALYTGKSWIQRGLVVKNNYFHDIETSEIGEVYGVYLDDFYCGATVEQNIFENISGGEDSAGYTGGGRDTTVMNNIFINTNASMAFLDAELQKRAEGEDVLNAYKESRQALWDSNESYGLKSANYDKEVYSKYPNILDYDDENANDTMTYKYSKIKNNISWKNKDDIHWRAFSYGSAGAVTAQQLEDFWINEIGVELEKSLVVASDPGFANYAEGDLTLLENSKVYETFEEFKAPDFENIGLYTRRLKNILGNSISMKVESPLSFTGFKYGMIDNENESVVPVIINDKTMVPIRYIAETIGGEAQWDDGTETATITVDEKVLKIDNKTKVMTINGEVIESEVAPCTVGGRFMIPLRVIAEKFGKTVEWHDGGLIIIGDEDGYFNEDNYAHSLMIGEMLRRLTY